MAELEPAPLSALLDPPLGDPPPVADLERRAERRRQRRWAGRGAGAAAVIALVAGAVALAEPDGQQTLRTAAPPSVGATSEASGGGATRSAALVLNKFEHAGKEWQYVAFLPDPGGVCTELRTDAGATVRSTGCWRFDAGALQGTATDHEGFSFVAAMVTKEATVVRLSTDTPELRLLGETAALPVNFVGFVVPDGVNSVDITAGTAGEPARYRTSVIVHARVSVINGQVGSATPTTPATTRAPSPTVTSPPTTVGPDTPVTTGVPPPTPTTSVPAGPPPGGDPQRVSVTPGATSLQKRVFETAFSSGASSVAVRWWDGVEPCAVLGRVDVAESADKVTVTLWTGIGPGAERMSCIAMAVYKETIVPLSAPLGSRTIVDGAA